MDTSTEIPVLDRKGLRQFGFVLGGAVVVFFGLLIPWLFSWSYPLWPWFVLAGLGVWALIHPLSLHPVYKTWMRFGLLMNRVTTPLILGVVFFVMIAPIGAVRRVFGKDSIPKRRDPNLQSYRTSSDEISRESLERPF